VGQRRSLAKAMPICLTLIEHIDLGLARLLEMMTDMAER
jgi:hypothetical protein